MDNYLMQCFPNVRRTVLDIALAQGAVNRIEAEHKVMDRAAEWIENNVAPDSLRELESWLGSLTAEELEVLADGEAQEMLDLVATSPVGLNGNCVATIFEKMFDDGIY